MRGKHTMKLAAKGYVRISRVLPLITYAVLCQIPRTFKQNLLMKKNDLFEESGFSNNPHKLSRFDTRDFYGHQAQILPGVTVPKTGH